VIPELTKAARRDLRRLAKSDAAAILDGIERFCESGVGNVKKLHDFKPPTWRLRVGRYRVLYRPEGTRW
jgi:mRNA-degrading endonuclease RelE of RelBE toxin-antitoxin system